MMIDEGMEFTDTGMVYTPVHDSEKITMALLAKYAVEETNELTETERGAGGFGHTGQQ